MWLQSVALSSPAPLIIAPLKGSPLEVQPDLRYLICAEIERLWLQDATRWSSRRSQLLVQLVGRPLGTLRSSWCALLLRGPSLWFRSRPEKHTKRCAVAGSVPYRFVCWRPFHGAVTCVRWPVQLGLASARTGLVPSNLSACVARRSSCHISGSEIRAIQPGLADRPCPCPSNLSTSHPHCDSQAVPRTKPARCDCRHRRCQLSVQRTPCYRPQCCPLQGAGPGHVGTAARSADDATRWSMVHFCARPRTRRRGRSKSTAGGWSVPRTLGAVVHVCRVPKCHS